MGGVPRPPDPRHFPRRSFLASLLRAPFGRCDAWCRISRSAQTPLSPTNSCQEATMLFYVVICSEPLYLMLPGFIFSPFSALRPRFQTPPPMSVSEYSPSFLAEPTHPSLIYEAPQHSQRPYPFSVQIRPGESVCPFFARSPSRVHPYVPYVFVGSTFFL